MQTRSARRHGRHDSARRYRLRHLGVRIDGWNYIPAGYGLGWDLAAAPRWLRIWFRVPLVDRFAYPVLVHRGVAFLTRHRSWTDDEREPVPPGWRVLRRAVDTPSASRCHPSQDE